MNQVEQINDFVEVFRFQKCWVEEAQRPKPWLLRALNRALGGRYILIHCSDFLGVSFESVGTVS